jgi:hypothetical protein
MQHSMLVEQVRRLFEFVATRDAETEVVQSDTVLIEPIPGGRHRE